MRARSPAPKNLRMTPLYSYGSIGGSRTLNALKGSTWSGSHIRRAARSNSPTMAIQPTLANARSTDACDLCVPRTISRSDIGFWLSSRITEGSKSEVLGACPICGCLSSFSVFVMCGLRGVKSVNKSGVGASTTSMRTNGFSSSDFPEDSGLVSRRQKLVKTFHQQRPLFLPGSTLKVTGFNSVCFKSFFWSWNGNRWISC